MLAAGNEKRPPEDGEQFGLQRDPRKSNNELTKSLRWHKVLEPSRRSLAEQSQAPRIRRAAMRTQAKRRHIPLAQPIVPGQRSLCTASQDYNRKSCSLGKRRLVRLK